MSDTNKEEKKIRTIKKAEWQKAKRIFTYIIPYKWQLAAGTLCLFIASGLFMVVPAVAGEMLNVANGQSKYGFDLTKLGLIMAAALLSMGFFSYFRVKFFTVVSERGLGDLRNDLFKKLITLDIPFFEKNRVGELTSRFTNDVEKLTTILYVTIPELLRQIITLVVGMGFMVFMAPRLSLLMVLTFPPIIIVTMFFGRYIRGMSKKRQEELAQSNVIVEETMQSVHSVKAYTNEWFEWQRYSIANQKVIDLSISFGNKKGLFSVFIITALFGALFFVMWMGARMVENGMPVGELVSFVLFTMVVGASFAALGTFYTELLSGIGASERIMEILDTPSETECKARNEEKPRFKGDIQYQNVNFQYPTRADFEVLKNINFQIKAGQKVALVGSSGSGKSTIIQLLQRFYKLENGSISIDGKKIEDYDITEYRSNIAIVPQEVMLFGGSIYENIRYGKPTATEAEIKDAAKKANALDFINNFPEGLQTMVGERGIKLSGGQRQRIAIARAILKDPSILILDEATSSLDAESERVVQEALNTLMEGRTSIIIAHRLATIRDVNMIYVIDKGEIAEQGTHDELIQKNNGLYKALADLQFRE